jgi:proline-specific peptidase
VETKPDRRQVVTALGMGILSTFGTALGAKRYAPLSSPPPGTWHLETEPVGQGFAAGPNGDIYYRIYGESGGTPVFALHGGPGAGELYMRPYVGLATDRQVVLYDQSGCGRSASPKDLSMYTVKRYVSELEALRAHLGFERIVILGHSWGSFLGPAYAAAHPNRVAGLVLAGGAPRVRDCAEAAKWWLKDFGKHAAATVMRAERTGNMDAAYRRLTKEYYARHVCRLDPLPAWFVKFGKTIARNPVYLHMNGPAEFRLSGALASLDITGALRGIRVPTLVTCGEYDEAPPWLCAKTTRLVEGSILHVFPGLSHVSHVEDPSQVNAITSEFLRANLS